MGMSVGVAEGRLSVGGTVVCVAIDGVEATVGGEEVAGDKTSTEKLHASSNSALDTTTISDGNHVRCFIAFSLSASANMIESATDACTVHDLPSKSGASVLLYWNPSLEFQTGNYYKTFAPGFLFPYRNEGPSVL